MWFHPLTLMLTAVFGHTLAFFCQPDWLWQSGWVGFAGWFTLSLIALRYRCRALASAMVFVWAFTWHLPSGARFHDQTASVLYRTPFSVDQGLAVAQVSTTERDVAVVSVSTRLRVGEVGRIVCRGQPIQSCSLTADQDLRSMERSFLDSAIRRVRAAIRDLIDRRAEILRPWLHALVLGDLTSMGHKTVAAFREVGLIHLLVISGFHIGLISTLVLILCIGVLRFGYAFKLLSCINFLYAHQLLKLLISVGAFLFAMLVGMGAASQRSALSFAIFQVTPLCRPKSTYLDRLCLALGAQLFCFPLAWFSSGNVMSWFGFILLSQTSSQADGGVLIKLFRIVLVQAAFVSCGFILFGQWSWTALLMNIVVLEYFCALCLFCMATLLPFIPRQIDIFVARLLEDFLRFIASFPAAPTHVMGAGELIQGYVALALTILFVALLIKLKAREVLKATHPS